MSSSRPAPRTRANPLASMEAKAKAEAIWAMRMAVAIRLRAGERLLGKVGMLPVAEGRGRGRMGVKVVRARGFGVVRRECGFLRT